MPSSRADRPVRDRACRRSAGISLEFALGKPRSHGVAEVIAAEIVEQADARFRPGSLKFATLGTNASTRIEILYNPIRVFRRDDATGHVLAHIFVHEITHVLEDVARHSASGIMKARWEGAIMTACTLLLFYLPRRICG